MPHTARQHSIGSSLAFTVLILACLPSLADTVVLKNGKTVEGEIVSEGEAEVVVKTAAGQLTIKMQDVKEVKKAKAGAAKERSAGSMTKEERAAALGLNAKDLHEAGEQLVDCPSCKGTGVAIWIKCLHCQFSPIPGQFPIGKGKYIVCERCGGNKKGLIPGAYCALCDRRGKVYLSQLKPSQGGTKKPPTGFAWCTKCSGTGADVWQDCNQCKRSPWKGYLNEGELISPCDRCGTLGKVPKHQCETCRGKGIVPISGDPTTQFVQPLTAEPQKK